MNNDMHRYRNASWGGPAGGKAGKISKIPLKRFHSPRGRSGLRAIQAGAGSAKGVGAKRSRNPVGYRPTNVVPVSLCGPCGSATLGLCSPATPPHSSWAACWSWPPVHVATPPCTLASLLPSLPAPATRQLIRCCSRAEGPTGAPVQPAQYARRITEGSMAAVRGHNGHIQCRETGARADVKGPAAGCGGAPRSVTGAKIRGT